MTLNLPTQMAMYSEMHTEERAVQIDVDSI